VSPKPATAFADRMLVHRLLILLPITLALSTLAAAPASAGDACPQNLATSAFTDLRGLSTEATAAIACVAAYGVAKGSTQTTFDPGSPVTRWQMALFLIRTAALAGVELPTGTTQGFTDIGSQPADTQKAINQLAQLGITTGTTPTTFAPAEQVSRWQMALFLTRLATKAGVEVPSGSDQGFTDLGGLAPAAQLAINQLAELGVAKGTSAGTFTPGEPVFRWQMALFLARQFGVLGVVPGGVTVTASTGTAQVGETVTLTILVKGVDGKPLTGAKVDVFVGSKDAAGKCVVDTDAKLAGVDGGTGTDCTIDSADPSTDVNGKVTVAFTHGAAPEIDSVYAWTAAVGTVFGPTAAPGSVQVTWVPPVSGVALTVVSPARYGSVATLSATLVSSAGAGLPIKDQKLVLVAKRGSTPIYQAVVPTDAEGKAVTSYLGPPDPTSGDDALTIDSVTVFWDKDGDGVDDGAGEFDATGSIQWDDTLPFLTQATLTQTTPSGLGGASATATITVKDKFGVPIQGAEVEFTVTGHSSVAPVLALTNGSGKAQFNYTGAAFGNGVDSINASVDLNANGTIEAGLGDLSAITALLHYWVEQGPTLGAGIALDLIAVDTVAKTIDVTNGSWFYRLSYDGDDTFNTGSTLVVMGTFESAISAKSVPAVGGGAELTVDYAAGLGANVFRLN